MQHISEKIQNLLEAKRLNQYDLATATSYDWRHLSRKLGERKSWSLQKTRLAAEFLGVTAEFLRNESQVFNIGDEIPIEAIARKKAGLDSLAAPDPSDAATILARTQEAMVSKWPEVLRAVVRAEMEKMMLEIIELRATVERLDKKSNQP